MGEPNADDGGPRSTSPRRATEVAAGRRPWWATKVVLLPKERRLLSTLVLAVSSVVLVGTVVGLMDVGAWTAVEAVRRLGGALGCVTAIITALQFRAIGHQPSQRLVVARLLLAVGTAMLLSVALVLEYLS